MLRTDDDWNMDVEAVTRSGSTTKFQIETERQYFYFKPVLLGDGTTMWSRGEIISLSQRREPRSRFIHSFAKIRSAACAS